MHMQTVFLNSAKFVDSIISVLIWHMRPRVLVLTTTSSILRWLVNEVIF